MSDYGFRGFGSRYCLAHLLSCRIVLSLAFAMTDIVVSVLGLDGTVIASKKYKPGIKKRVLLLALQGRHGVGDLKDSKDYDIEPSDEIVDAGAYSYSLSPSPSTGPGNHQSITRQQWLKQKLPPLRLAFSAAPTLRNEDILFYPESVKMWKSFGGDVADYVASLASSDEVPFNSSVDFGDVEIYAGSNEESVRSVYEIILIALLRFHNFPGSTIAPSQRFSASSVRAYRDNLSPASARVLENADNLDCRQFIQDWLLTFGPRHSLLIEYKKTSFFRQSNEPLPDLVSAYALDCLKNEVFLYSLWSTYRGATSLWIRRAHSQTP